MKSKTDRKIRRLISRLVSGWFVFWIGAGIGYLIYDFIKHLN